MANTGHSIHSNASASKSTAVTKGNAYNSNRSKQVSNVSHCIRSWWWWCDEDDNYDEEEDDDDNDDNDNNNNNNDDDDTDDDDDDYDNEYNEDFATIVFD